jgi:hypothetical protein
MNFKALQDSIRSLWVLPASGLPDNAVYFATQNGPSLAPGPCITIALGGPVRIGMLDPVTKTVDLGAPNGKEIVFTSKGLRELVVTLQAFSPQANALDMENDARELLSRIDASLALPTIRPSLNKIGLGVLRQGNVVWQPGIIRAGWEGRAVLETVFCVSETATGAVGYIETANITGTVDNVAEAYTLVVED